MIEITNLDNDIIKTVGKRFKTKLKYLIKNNTLEDLIISNDDPDEEILLENITINNLYITSDNITFRHCKIGRIVCSGGENTGQPTNVILENCDSHDYINTSFYSSFLVLRNLQKNCHVKIKNCALSNNFELWVEDKNDLKTFNNATGTLEITSSQIQKVDLSKNYFSKISIFNSQITSFVEHNYISNLFNYFKIKYFANFRLNADYKTTYDYDYDSIKYYKDNNIEYIYDIQGNYFNEFQLIRRNNIMKHFEENIIDGSLSLFAINFSDFTINNNVISVIDLKNITEDNVITKKFFNFNKINYQDNLMVIKDLFANNYDRFGYKVIDSNDGIFKYYICKLFIPKEALYLEFPNESAFKKRCSFAKVEEIYVIKNGTKEIKHCSGTSLFNRTNNIKYIEGTYVKADSFDVRENKQCSHGIHFFDTEKEAIEYAEEHYS